MGMVLHGAATDDTPLEYKEVIFRDPLNGSIGS